jgi:hypothetical protein
MDKLKGDLGLYAIVDGLLSLGFLAGAPIAAALGNFLLTLVLLILAAGFFLRFKRTTAWRKKKPASK